MCLLLQNDPIRFSSDLDIASRNSSDTGTTTAATTTTTAVGDCENDADCPENCYCVFKPKTNRMVCKSLLGNQHNAMCKV